MSDPEVYLPFAMSGRREALSAPIGRGSDVLD